MRTSMFALVAVLGLALPAEACDGVRAIVIPQAVVQPIVLQSVAIVQPVQAVTLVQPVVATVQVQAIAVQHVVAVQAIQVQRVVAVRRAVIVRPARVTTFRGPLLGLVQRTVIR